jgi:hypothetical protein
MRKKEMNHPTLKAASTRKHHEARPTGKSRNKE